MSNFTIDGCVLNIYADDEIIYTSAATSDDLQLQLQRCVDNIYHWYFRHKITINKKKSAVMIIGSKIQLQSLNLDQFSIQLESNKIELVNRAKYLGLLVKDDLSWDEHILQLCKNKNYNLHVLRRLKIYFLSNYCLKYINHIFSPNWIMDSPSGDALLKVISIVCRESKMLVLESYVITMIILTLSWFVSLTR